MYPRTTAQMIRISILVRERDGKRGDVPVERLTLRVESRDLIFGTRISFYLYVTLIILNE